MSAYPLPFPYFKGLGSSMGGGPIGSPKDFPCKREESGRYIYIYIYIYSRKVLFTLGEVGLKRISSLEEKNYKSWYRMGWNELLK